MATVKELEAEIKQLKAALAAVGIGAAAPPPTEPEERPDYIEHGSLEHAQYKGLVLLEDESEADERVTYKSRQTGQLYCLEDERRALYLTPSGLSLREAATIILREKVNDFESGPPQAPEDAPPMWTPTPLDEALAGLR